MPERILRDLTDSDRYNSISVAARDTFIRLINKADDFGCFYADARRCRSLLYPLLIDQVREADMQRWIAECEKSGLIALYVVDGKQYLQVSRWRQRLRSKNPKFPKPPWGWGSDPDHRPPHDGHLPDMCQTYARHPRTETETETETHTEAETKGGLPALPPDLSKSPEFVKAWADWVIHRKEIKKPITRKAAEIQYRQMLEWGAEASIEAIETAISSGWQGLFPPKGKKIKPAVSHDEFASAEIETTDALVEAAYGKRPQ